MNTRVIKIEQSGDIEAVIAQASQVLNQSGLVGFPTETVYGLAARADRAEAVARLRQIKQRADKPFTLHIGKKSVLDRYVPDLSLLDRVFLRKAWPGPITVIFKLSTRQQEQLHNHPPAELIDNLYHNNSIGIRLPDHAPARQLLCAVDGPIVAPSGNLAGTAEPVCAEDVLEQLDGKIELLLDGGPTRFKKPSTIVEFDKDQMKIIRPGVLDMAAVERMRRMTILFVCTGNTCRSPMAVGFCRSRLAKKLSCTVDQLSEKGYKIKSAGVMAFEGSPATAGAVQACRQAGVDIGPHQALLLTVNMLNEADFIFVMEWSHYQAVRQLSPQAANRTALLAEDSEIEDPIGMPTETYRKCAERIADGVNKLLEKRLLGWDIPDLPAVSA